MVARKKSKSSRCGDAMTLQNIEIAIAGARHRGNFHGFRDTVRAFEGGHTLAEILGWAAQLFAWRCWRTGMDLVRSRPPLASLKKVASLGEDGVVRMNEVEFAIEDAYRASYLQGVSQVMFAYAALSREQIHVLWTQFQSNCQVLAEFIHWRLGPVNSTFQLDPPYIYREASNAEIAKSGANK